MPGSARRRVWRSHALYLEAQHPLLLGELEPAHRAGAVSRAEAIAREAADLAEAVGFPYVRGSAAHVRGEVALATGVVHEAMTHLRSAIDLFGRIDAPYE